MHLAADYVNPTPRGGRCRVRIYLPEEERDAPVVICTEPRDNPGMSITNAAEQIAAEVISSRQLPTPLVWIEHYEAGARRTPQDRHTFDLVLFEHYEVRDELRGGEWRKEVGEPSWKALDRATVEALIGGPLEEG
jgi:hypothetical protein